MFDCMSAVDWDWDTNEYRHNAELLCYPRGVLAGSLDSTIVERLALKLAGATQEKGALEKK